MLHTDPIITRPTLTHPRLLATALDRLRSKAGSTSEVWQLLTENFVVDLDAVAAMLPAVEAEPHWLPARD